MITICNNWEINFYCKDGCGVSIFNADKVFTKCPECGGKLYVVNPLNSRRKKYGSKVRGSGEAV